MQWALRIGLPSVDSSGIGILARSFAVVVVKPIAGSFVCFRSADGNSSVWSFAVSVAASQVVGAVAVG